MGPSDREKTQVDLGVDLLDQTQSRVGFKNSSTPNSTSNSNRFEDAEILYKEGLFAKAKRILRKILFGDSRDIQARKLLEKIESEEIQGWLRSPAKARSGETQTVVDWAEDAEEPISESAMKEIIQVVDQSLMESSLGDRIDLGIAFLQMGLFPVAKRIFGQTARHSVQASVPNLRIYSTASNLMALTALEQGKPFETVLILEPLLRDAEISDDQKLDCFYLVGRAYESLGKTKAACQWYRQTVDRDPEYRDAAARLARLQNG